MAFKKLKWNAIDTFGLYLSAIAFLVWKIYTMIVPTAYTPKAQSGQMVLLGGVILATLYYLIKQLEKLGLNPYSPQSFSSFAEGFNDWLNDIRELDDVTICAYTSHTFREALWSSRKKMGRVRVLLFYPTDDFPNVEGESDQSVGSIQNTIELWKVMAVGQPPQIANLEIRQRRYNATMFFGVVNRKKAIHGLLFPRKGMGGLEPQGVFVLREESASMRTQIDQYMDWFEEMWKVADPR